MKKRQQPQHFGKLHTLPPLYTLLLRTKKKKEKTDNNLNIMAGSTQARKYLVDKLNVKNYIIWIARMEQGGS